MHIYVEGSIVVKGEDKFKISMVTLGCSKNLVDAECMVRLLRDHGYIVIENASEADIIIINTCGFIDSAKSEAISAILDAGELKASGHLSHIIVTGCLPQRYSEEILQDLPEVDMVLGTAHYKDICAAVDSLISGDEDKNDDSEPASTDKKCIVSAPGGMEHLLADRDISTTGYAWLKIAEGCVHRCAFCAIPLIRGKYVSRPMEAIIEEARVIASKGYKEIILAAQDTTNYGIDLYKSRKLPELLRALSSIEGIEVIRIMYGYMDGIDDELIAEITANPKVANYLDIPIQHGDNRILRSMFRKESAETITERLNKLRDSIPGLIVRTTVMVGFPGETEEEFNNLKENLTKWEFDRLGCFIFSPEEGTKAYDMDGQIDDETKQRRYDEIYELQQAISTKKNAERLGSIVTVTIDSVSDDGISYVGRSYGEAPEVDPIIRVYNTNELEPELIIGNRYDIRIVESSEYELTGVTI